MKVEVNNCRELRELEESLLQPAVRRDREHLSALLAEEFREFGSSGRVFSRSEILEELESEPERELTLKDFACEAVGAEVVLVTYTSVRVEAGAMPGEALRSSLWVRRAGRWQMLFHQGTRVTV
jgi:hypothetical protein